jgi:hypothetical protein
MADIELTLEQEAEAARIAEIITEKMKDEALLMARLLVSKPDAEFFGKTEYEIRDRVHRIGACAIETALEERKKGGTKGRAKAARTAKNRLDS